MSSDVSQCESYIFHIRRIKRQPSFFQILSPLSQNTVKSTLHRSCSSIVKKRIMKSLSVQFAGFDLVNGIYNAQPPESIPKGFDRTCQEMNWDTEQLWQHLSDQKRPWFMHTDNDSYIYWNKGDGKWWIDGPTGAGAYIVRNDGWSPPRDGWYALSHKYNPVPTVEMSKEKGL